MSINRFTPPHPRNPRGTPMADNAVTRAHEALHRAEAKIREAQHARDDAHEQLEAELARRGWARLRGAFHPGATPLYTNVLYPGATLEVNQVIEVLERQRAAAA